MKSFDDLRIPMSNNEIWARKIAVAITSHGLPGVCTDAALRAIADALEAHDITSAASLPPIEDRIAALRQVADDNEALFPMHPDNA